MDRRSRDRDAVRPERGEAVGVQIVMIEKLDCILSKSATRPYIYEYKCECVRTHLCIDLSGRQ